MKRIVIYIALISLPFFAVARVHAATGVPWWPVQSVDTMKYSRDLARERLHDRVFRQTIDAQVAAIAGLHANFVAVATPYDDEFLPFLTAWVAAARTHGLHVWFRGNFSGWEQWFGYPAISPQQHLQLVSAFIRDHADLFADGDIFSTCPECENGSLGDPRHTGKIAEYRRFLIAEYQACTQAFAEIGKHADCRYFSMNKDVAEAVMDPDTTRALGGLVTIDHYVRDPQQLASDIRNLAITTGGSVVLGEFGAPIPDIHGTMTQPQQAAWIAAAFQQLIGIRELTGVNYWLAVGGSTALFDDDGSPRQATAVVRDNFMPPTVSGTVTDDIDHPLAGVTVTTGRHTVKTDGTGKFTVPYADGEKTLRFTSDGWETVTMPATDYHGPVRVALRPSHRNLIFYLRTLLYRWFRL